MIATFRSLTLKKMKPTDLRFLQNGITSKIASNREYKNVKINVPWGRVTGKYWGPTDVNPIIAVHGWQDNASSFDPLMNYLPENVSVLAIDLPGHGYSSWIPNGFMYNSLLYVQTIERVRQHYEIDKMAMIGHSMGSMISFYYASHFPDNMKFVVALDNFKPPSFNASKYIPQYIKEWNAFFKLEKNRAVSPRYDEDDAIQITAESRRNTLNKSTCKILNERGTTKHRDGTISFMRDPRVEFFTIDNAFTHDYLKLLATRLEVPYRILKSENCHSIEDEKLYYDVMQVIETHSRDFAVHIVPEKHYFHMDNPQAVAHILNPFIAKYL